VRILVDPGVPLAGSVERIDRLFVERASVLYRPAAADLGNDTNRSDFELYQRVLEVQSFAPEFLIFVVYSAVFGACRSRTHRIASK
jgi:hypothetical protein